MYTFVFKLPNEVIEIKEVGLVAAIHIFKYKRGLADFGNICSITRHKEGQKTAFAEKTNDGIGWRMNTLKSKYLVRVDTDGEEYKMIYVAANSTKDAIESVKRIEPPIVIIDIWREEKDGKLVCAKTIIDVEKGAYR